MNVPKNVTDEMLVDFLASFLGIKAQRSFRCDACGRHQRNTWIIYVDRTARRGCDWRFAVTSACEGSIETLKPTDKRKRTIVTGRRLTASWCVSCCRTFRNLTRVDLVRARLLASVRPEPDPPF